MPRVAEEAGADSLTFHNLIFTDARLLEEQRRCDAMLGCSSGDWEGFNFEPGLDPEELYDRMSRILSREHKFSMDFYPNFSRAELIKYYRDPCFSPGLRCLSPWIAAYVFPDGEVRPCLNCTYSYGNIKSSSFGSSWNGDKAIAFRRALKKAGAFPLCRRCTELYRY
jgi:radical SAM protein with 4Fe4S-binding SPASM domain